MKVHKPPTSGSRRSRIRKRPENGPAEACAKLYWIHAPDFLFELKASQTGQFVYESINPAFEALLGLSSEDIRDRAISDCMSDEDARSICASCEACLTEGRPIRYQHRLGLGGRYRNFETVVTPVQSSRNGSIVRIVGSHTAIKEAATCDVVETAKRQVAANLGVRLLALQEEMQQRIASDLHDSTCQHLIAASLNVMRLRRAMNDIGNAEKLCDDVDTSIDRALVEIRAFTYLLHPQNLLADGLKIAIEQFANGFSARTSLKTSLKITGQVDELSHEKQRSVLRVIQEALANVYRHAQATEVKVAMEVADTCFKLRISDNGRGMPIDQPRSGPKAISFGVGIPAMRTRLQQMGGALEIHSSPATGHRGTTLRAVIPHSRSPKRVRPRQQHQSDLGQQKSVAQ